MSNPRETEYNIWVEVRVVGCGDDGDDKMLDFGPKVDVLPTLKLARKTRDQLLTDFSALAALGTDMKEADKYGLFQVFACVEEHVTQPSGADYHKTLEKEERELGLFSTWQLARRFVHQIAPGDENAW